MKHAVIVAHPDPHSFNLAVAQAYCEAARAHGHEPLLRDLYRLGPESAPFDPRMRSGELPRPEGFTPGDDVCAERAVLSEAQVFAFVYPLWFNAPPAMLKGYVERVFGMGFGYGPIRGGGNTPLLGGRRMISFSSSGGPEAWLEAEGAIAALRNLFDAHFAQVCGLDVVDHLHFGGITPGVRPDVVRRCLDAVGAAARRTF